MGSVHTLRKRVLVVEDSPIILRLIEVCFRPMNLDVTMVPNGIAGLESAAIYTPNLVVLDIGLPGIDGWEVLAGLQRAELTERVPVLMLTGHGESFGEAEATQRGAAGFMTKPSLPEALRATVTGLLRAA
jgi:DNA-binding response OmpR family regulator